MNCSSLPLVWVFLALFCSWLLALTSPREKIEEWALIKSANTGIPVRAVNWLNQTLICDLRFHLPRANISTRRPSRLVVNGEDKNWKKSVFESSFRLLGSKSMREFAHAHFKLVRCLWMRGTMTIEEEDGDVCEKWTMEKLKVKLRSHFLSMQLLLSF